MAYNTDDDSNNGENLPVEQSSNNEMTEQKSNENSVVNKKIQERLSKSLTKNAAKQTLLKLLMPIITWGAIFIIAIIVIIGIAMFFITMPGMVIEQIKELANKVGNAVAAWFGADVTKQIEDVEIYDTLEYLEQMGYDLKGYGFLTGYVGNSDDGVERDENDQITDAESDFISTYLVSDKYMYTIKNFNLVADDPIDAIGKRLKGIFQGDNSAWTRGMIYIGLDGGNLGVNAEEYTKGKMGYIKIDADKKTMEIKRGWFNNSMTYNLDGWTGRYGMPIDFLLSVHLATMMPDLAYDMATSFNTEIELLLHPVGGGEKDENTAIGYYKVGEDEYVSYDQVHEIADSNAPLDAWRVSKKEAKKIMDELNIKSPDNCTGTADFGFDNVWPDKDGGDDKTIPLSYNELIITICTHEEDYFDNEKGEEKLEELKSRYAEMIAKLKEYGATDEDITAAGLMTEINSYEDFKNMQDEIESDKENVNYHEKSRGRDFYLNWVSTNSNYQTYTAEITLGYDNFYDYSIPNAEYYYNVGLVNYKIKGEWTQERIEEYLKENEITAAEENRCSQTDVSECCSSCREYIQKIYDLLKKADVSELDIYQPYISKVTNHWYRDVYFVANGAGKKFVDYDYAYEALMKERWTLYETYKEDDGEEDLIGEYKLYTTDGKLYHGTAEDAAADNIKVSKKAEMVKIGDVFDELDWDKIGEVYSAYEVSEASLEDMQLMYPDIEKDDPDYLIKKDIYANVITTGNVVQTGEGQREETNDDIKKMFLENTYFRYDGSAKTAEIITKLRNSKNMGYGSLSESDLKQTVKIDGETYKASEYAGQVSLNQDSLNAFSMLENEHTLDADYIYRDFKELIVELGYFEKEELTDETPRIMQWLIPDIGSNGYPNRAIDKNIHEYGTMIHSKGDIDVNNELTLRAIIEQAKESGEPESPPDSGEEPPDFTYGDKERVDVDKTDENTEEESKTSKLIKDNSLNMLGQIASLDSTPLANLQTVGSITEVAAADYTYTATGSSSQQTKIADLVFNGVSYECWWQTSVTCTLYSFAFVASAYTETNFEEYIQETAPYWCPGLSSSCFSTAGVEGVYYGWSQAIPSSVEEQGTLISQALSEGKPVYFYSGFQSSGGRHAIVLLGASEEGQILYYNPWGGVIESYGTSSSFSSNLTTLLTTGVKEDGGTLYSFFIPAEPPTGVKIETGGDPYEGYQGNEYVVSPVTGVLLEYGTYTDDDVDDSSGEKYRTNVDLKYGTNILMQTEENSETENTETKDTEKTNTDNKTNSNNNSNSNTNNTSDKKEDSSNSGANGKIQVDKVGYAKILVLDKENYQKLENAILDSTRWEDSLLNSKGNYKELEISEKQVNSKTDPWSDLDKTLYGYKEFAELYEKFGIAGNVIYIDGFKCNQVDDEFDIKKDGDTKSPEGDKIEFDDFKEIVLSDFDSKGNLSDSEGLLETLYQKDDTYKLASKDATEKLNTESLIKNEALSSIKFEDGEKDIVIIKEGTVLGRTMTDFELIEDRNETKEENEKELKYSDYRKTSDSAKDMEESVIGNYIRIIMRDKDKTVVENVEDYIKLDDGTKKSQSDHFSIVGTVLDKQEWVQKAISYVENNYSGATESPFKSTEDMGNFYDICVDKGVNPEYAFATAAGESGFSSSNGNFWGLGTPNTSSSLATYGTWAVTLEAYCDTIISYQDPANWEYDSITKTYNERLACTDNGGIDPNGFGLPDTIQGVQSLYSDLGKHGDAYSGSGKGGYYYMDPAIANVTKIYTTHEEFLSKCRNKGGVHASGTDVTTWENGQYTAWQVEKKIFVAKEAFGDLAGTHNP